MKLLTALLVALMLLMLYVLAFVVHAEACCEDFVQAGYSITPEQLQDFGYAVVGYNRVHIVPIAFASGVMAISLCESTDNPGAVSPNGCLGLLQLCKDSAMLRVVHSLGYEWADMLDPDANLDVGEAWWRATGYNWSHWACWY